MVKEIIVKAYIGALEEVLSKLETRRVGRGFISRKSIYQIRDTAGGSIARLIRATAEEVNYDNDPEFIGRSPRQRLYSTFIGGMNSPGEIKGEVESLIEYARGTLSSADKP